VTDSDPTATRMGQTESQCRARFGIWVGESTASRLSLIARVAQGRKRIVPPCRATRCECRGAGLADQLHILHTLRKCRRHAPCYLFQKQHVCYAPESLISARAKGPSRTRDAGCDARGRGGLGCAVGREQCIGTVIGNRLVLSLC
jgi:hypothetical protein